MSGKTRPTPERYALRMLRVGLATAIPGIAALFAFLYLIGAIK